MAEAGLGALAAAKGIELAAKFGEQFMPHAVNFVVNAFDKVGFDLDRTGRERQTKWMNETAQIAYAPYDVNIAIWNMHLREDHHFEGLLFSGLQRMGNGGGFRIVVFTGAGWIRNDGDRGFCNWLCSGNQTQKDNVITFWPVRQLPGPCL